MATLLATVDQLAARLGVQLVSDTLEYNRAEAALEDVSIRARGVAAQSTWTVNTVPDEVRTVVLAAARRIYVNPDRYLSNMAGSFQATMAQNEFTGDIFMSGEMAVLRKYQSSPGLWVQSTTRVGNEPFDPTRYWADDYNHEPILLLEGGQP